MKKVAMIGVGKLGQDCAEVMAQHYDVVGYDVLPRSPKFVMKDTIEDAIKDRDIIFIAAPTPHEAMYGGETPTSHLPNKDFDYSIVTNILREVNLHARSNQLVVLISTVLPGTTRNLLRPCITNARFIYNPYLIAMGTVKWDMVNPEMVIIGTEDGSITGDAQELIDFYSVFMENNPRYEVGTWDEAEAIKIFYNTFISTKLALVNMIQDVAEINGNMNVDTVTNALAKSTYRIMGPAYMKAGLGDAGACHPRDNIALRYLADRLHLGYDLFDSIMKAREVQAENMARRCLKNGRRVTIVGKAYKPKVHYTEGSASLLIGHYIGIHGGEVRYYDPHTGDNDLHEEWTDVYLIGYWDTYTEALNFPQHTVVIDPWRRLDHRNHTGEIIHYGDTRPKKKHKLTEEELIHRRSQIIELIPEVGASLHRAHIIDVNIHPECTFRLRPTEDIVEEILQAIENGKDRIIFDCCPETLLDSIILKLHRIHSLVAHKINPSHFVLLTGASTQKSLYKHLCTKHNIKGYITIVCTNYFHYATRLKYKPVEFTGDYEVTPREKKFLCFNKVPRQHRIKLLDNMYRDNIVHMGHVSFEGSEEFFARTIYSPMCTNIVKNKEELPLRLNITNERPNPVDIIPDDFPYFKSSSFSIITETDFYTNKIDDTVFISEKTFKAIAMKHPFIILGKPHILGELHALGYKTFSPFIDESYDQIENDDLRLEAVYKEIKRLCTYTSQWLDFYKEVKPIVEYNHMLFFKDNNRFKVDTWFLN